MTGEHTQARLQRIEKDVRNLSATVSVLAAVDSAAAKQRIDETFGADVRMVVISTLIVPSGRAGQRAIRPRVYAAAAGS